MSQEKIRPTAYAIQNLISGLYYVDEHQKGLIREALLVLQKRHNGLTKETVNEMLRHLEEAYLISHDTRDSVVKKLFSEKI